MKRVLFLTLAFLAGCPSTGDVQVPCRTNANCPSGYGCNEQGYCEKGAAGTSGVRVIIAPGSANVAVGATQQFTATVDGEGTAVSWTLEGEGNITQEGLYTAPVVAPASGQATLHATSSTDSAATATALVFIVGRNPQPTLTALTPSTVTAGAPDVSVQLDGTGFVGGTVVSVDGAEVLPSEVTATTMKIVLAAAKIAQGATLAVSVTNPAPGGGTTPPLSFTVNNAVPTVTSLSPDRVGRGAPDTDVVVSGSGFNAKTIAKLGTVPLTVKAVAPGALTVTLPAGELAATKTVALVVENPLPGGGTAQLDFLVGNPVPVLTSLSPDYGLVGGSAVTVTLTGSAFEASTTAQIGATPLATTYLSATSLTAVVPATMLQAAGTLQLSVTTPAPGGGTSSPVVFTVEQNPAPVLTSVSPAFVSAGVASLSLSLVGTGFRPTSVVRVGSTDLATAFVDDTHLTATVPGTELAAPGILAVSVFNPAPGGGTSAPQDFTVVGDPAPVLDGVSPASAAAGTATVSLTLTGSGFLPRSVASAGATALTTNFVDSTHLTATMPGALLAGAGVLKISVSTAAPGGGTSGTQDFTVVGDPAPVLASVSPATADAGTASVSLTLTGTGFLPRSVASAGATALTTAYVDSTHLTATLPGAMLAAPGVLQISVATAAPGGGTSATLPFTVANPVPVVLSLSPGSAALNSAGFTLTVNGGGFVSNSKVMWGSTPLATTFASTSQLTAAVPATFTQTPASVDVTVDSPAPGGGTSNAQKFDVNNPAPTLAAVSPSLIALFSPDTPVDVTGTGFVTTSKVRLDGVELATTYVSGTALSAVIPAAQLVTGRLSSVTVLNDAPGGGTSNSTTLTVSNPKAVLGSLTPPSALAGSSGIALTINGANFVPGITVTFGGQSLSATWLNANQVSVTVPANQLVRSNPTVVVTAKNPAPDGGSANDLAFRIDPVIRSTIGGYNGDGGPAVSAALERVWFMARATNGDLYYSEQERHRIMKIEAATGNVVRVAGNNLCGFTGDGAPASGALLCNPRGLDFDASGNLFFADASNNRIRMIDTTGVITTVAGTGSCSQGIGATATTPIGDPYDLKVGPSGALYVSVVGCSGHSVRQIFGGNVAAFAGTGTGGYNGDGIPASTAQLYNPYHLYVDSSENLYIADWSNARIRMVDAATLTMNTFAGTGANGLGVDGLAATATNVAYMRGMWMDSAGNFYLAQQEYYRIRKIDGTTGLLSTYAGTGVGGPLTADGQPATTSHIGRASALLHDGTGLVFSTFEDYGQDYTMIKRVDDVAKTVTTLAGAYPAPASALKLFLYRPYGVVVDGVGNYYVSDRETDRIWKIDVSGAVTRVAGTGVRGMTGDGDLALKAQISAPEQMTLDSSGNLYFVDAGNSRIRKVDLSGNISTVAGGGGWPSGCPAGVPASVPSGADSAVYNCWGDGYYATAAVLMSPRWVIRSGSSLYITEYNSGTTGYPDRGNRVRRVDLTTGFIYTLAGGTATSGTCAFSGDGAAASAARLCAPVGLAIDAAGDLLVADSSNRRIRKINLVTSPVGNINTVAGTGGSGSSGNGGPAAVATFRRPWGLLLDAFGNLFVSDYESHNVRRIDSTFIINQFAGVGSAGFGGDLGAAKDANLYYPTQMGLSPNSQLVYIADTNNERIRQVGP